MRDLRRSETRRERGVRERAGRLPRKLFSRQLRHLIAIPMRAPAAKRGLTGEWSLVTSRSGGVFGQVRHGITPRTTGRIHRRIGTDVVRLCENSMHIFISVEVVAKREGMSST